MISSQSSATAMRIENFSITNCDKSAYKIFWRLNNALLYMTKSYHPECQTVTSIFTYKQYWFKILICSIKTVIWQKIQQVQHYHPNMLSTEEEKRHKNTFIYSTSQLNLSCQPDIIYRGILISIRDLHQKKLVQFFFWFLLQQWRGKKSVVCVAQCVAALILVHPTLPLISDVYLSLIHISEPTRPY